MTFAQVGQGHRQRPQYEAVDQQGNAQPQQAVAGETRGALAFVG